MIFLTKSNESRLNIEEVEEAKNIGKKLLIQRLIDGASGNMSFKKNEFFYITKTGIMLDEINEGSFVKMGVWDDNKFEAASSDQLIHREIYRKSNYKAVLHCHGTFNVVLSFIKSSLYPIDLEGRIFIKDVKIINGKFGSKEIAEKVATEIKRRGITIVRGHGIYCADENLSKCYKKASYLEHSCEVLYRLEELQTK